ncbi:MAG: hypothetical protein DRO00_07530 [Thermoproteota archaeon]|nr:MAG: hypothetical protein DRO00_07530 [Candidatus Korarchaeota archaeon]
MQRRQNSRTDPRLRIVHKSKDFREAEAWDIEQHVSMTPSQRQRVAYELKKKAFGRIWIDVRRARNTH